MDSVFSNPTNGIVYLKLNENSIQNFRIEVKDITGRIVFRTMSMQNKIIEMNLDGPAGVYFLNSSNELNTTFKIIKIE
ncbi:MAG: T9SS type A sorting domain-containing protein [Bacteroidetes bacterium]|nr:T9SS type A sorting domain-containing protein [Bacteroidota bacterium]